VSTYVCEYPIGLSGGLATCLLPMYMTEIAPLKLRGAVGVLCQLGITCGVLMGQIAGLDTVLGTPESWHIMLASFLPLCLAALLLTIVLPESPKYLYIIKGEQGKALKGVYDVLGPSKYICKNFIFTKIIFDLLFALLLTFSMIFAIIVNPEFFQSSIVCATWI